MITTVRSNYVSNIISPSFISLSVSAARVTLSVNKTLSVKQTHFHMASVSQKNVLMVLVVT